MQLNTKSIRTGHPIVALLGMPIRQRLQLLSGMSPWVMESARRAKLI